MDFLTTQEISIKWNITSRRVSKLCKEGRIIGQENMSDNMTEDKRTER